MVHFGAKLRKPLCGTFLSHFL